MFAVMGVTGQVGGGAAAALLDAGKRVRAVVRDRAKGEAWAVRGCEVAVAETEDVAALTAAFEGVEAAYVMLPPTYDPSEDFAEVRAKIEALVGALKASQVRHVVALSTVGGQVDRFNLLQTLHWFEEALATLPMPVTVLRAAWFLENAAWDVAPTRGQGVMPSYLQPLERAVPMVSAEDVGRTAAALLMEGDAAPRVVELEGPAEVSPNGLAAAFAEVLGKPVRAEAVAREGWEREFVAAGMKNPAPRIAMLDGFNEGWISFEGGGVERRKGSTDVRAVVRKLVSR